MGYAQDLLDEIERDELLEKKEKEKLIEQEVEESLRDAMEQELSGKLNYNRSAQRLIDQVK